MNCGFAPVAVDQCLNGWATGTAVVLGRQTKAEARLLIALQHDHCLLSVRPLKSELKRRPSSAKSPRSKPLSGHLEQPPQPKAPHYSSSETGEALGAHSPGRPSNRESRRSPREAACLLTTRNGVSPG
jgi:hypothetical protein